MSVGKTDYGSQHLDFSEILEKKSFSKHRKCTLTDKYPDEIFETLTKIR